MKKLVYSIILSSLIIISCNNRFKIKSRYGTTVLTFATNDSIWVATDSKEGDSTVCKITSHNNIDAAVSGHVEYHNARNGKIYFSVHPLILKVLQENKTIDKSFKEIDSTIVKQLTDLNSLAISRNNLSMFSENPNDIILEITMSTFENGTPRVLEWAYRLTGDVNKWNIETIRNSNHAVRSLLTSD